MLKSYQQFLNENKVPSITEIPERFKEFVDELTDRSAYENNDSFSRIAQNNSSSTSMQDEIDDIIKDFETKYSDIDLKIMVKEYSEYIDAKFNSYNKKYGNDMLNEHKVHWNGMVDMVLNHFNKWHGLGGMNIQDDENTLIKYLYGWHHNKYGKMAILDDFDSLEKYYEWVEKGLEYDIRAIDSDSDFKVVENIIIGKEAQRGRHNKAIDRYESDNVNLGDDVNYYVSSNTDHYLVLLNYPYSTYKQTEPEERERYIVDKLIEHGAEGYLAVFDFDTSHIDDERIKKLKGVGKTMGKFNI